MQKSIDTCLISTPALTHLHQHLTYFPMRLTVALAHKAGSYVQESLLELKWLL